MTAIYRQPLNRVAPMVFPDGTVQDSAGQSATQVSDAIYRQDFQDHANCLVSNLRNGDTMVFNQSTQKWVNQPAPASGDIDAGTF